MRSASAVTASCTFCQVPDEKTPDKASDALNEQIKNTEGERLR